MAPGFPVEEAVSNWFRQVLPSSLQCLDVLQFGILTGYTDWL